MDWFNAIISKEDQYEVSKAKAEIAFKFHIGSITARNMVTLIAFCFGPDAR